MPLLFREAVASFVSNDVPVLFEGSDYPLKAGLTDTPLRAPAWLQRVFEQSNRAQRAISGSVIGTNQKLKFVVFAVVRQYYDLFRE